MSAEKVAAIRSANNNTTASRVFLDENDELAKNSANNDVPNPIETFAQCFEEYPDLMGKKMQKLITAHCILNSDLNISAQFHLKIVEQIQRQGFEKPSPIQAQAWPVLMKGEDLIGIAQTGTGKTI